MDIQYALREHSEGLPPLEGDEFTRQRGYGRSRGGFYHSGLSPTMASTPMPISNSFSAHQFAPPPLPPPRYVPVHGQPSCPVEPGRREAEDDDLPAYQRRANKDEGYGSLYSSAGSRSKPSASLARFGAHHERFEFRPDVAYDHSLLKKLDVRRRVDNRSPPRSLGAISSSRDGPRPHDHLSILKPLSLPTRTKQSTTQESPSRASEIRAKTAASPLSQPFGLPHLSRENSDHDMRLPLRSRRTDSVSIPDDATISSQASYMDIDDVDFSVEEPTRLQNFHLDGTFSRAGDQQAVGQKRRASSPLHEQPPSHITQSTNDLFKRRDAPPRPPPALSRLSAIPQGSECAIPPTSRSSPFTSNISLIASSITTSIASPSPGDRRSPSAMSHSGLSPTDTGSCTSPYATSISLTTSPGSLASRTPHLRTLSIEQTHSLVSPRKVVAEIPKANITKLSGFFMCECCPKKPKKFDTAEELSLHEAEKQYECSFCGNRFKNKNEAERHQNSLHVRRHSWSCSTLSGYDRAFHESMTHPGEADVCGYCGEEFTRSGHTVGRSSPRIATEHDWDERIRHLQDIHKFQECNSSKKFYRADHFRQHLKHSHAGTSGKWTNLLENACMLEEDPPIPTRGA